MTTFRGRAALVGLTAAILIAVASVSWLRPAEAESARASTLLASLVVEDDSTEPYDRDLFDHWIDEDGDGCDTRAEVLIAESTAVAVIAACTVVGGSWTSWFDGATWSAPADVDIDHLVPLAEAWRSGAWSWTPAQRRAFANDLVIPESLNAVTDEVNQSKGDKDPADWLPPDADVHCRYVTEWIVVKHRWNLTIDATEAATLTSKVGSCGDPWVAIPPDAGTLTRPPGSPFNDIPAGHAFADDIAWLVDAGITAGYADGGFHPTAPVSRQAMAAFLYRYTHGADPAEGCAVAWFPDVATTASLCPHIAWLASTGITSGYADGGFHPTAPVSRQAMAAFLQRYRDAESPTADTCTMALFTDMPAGFCVPITWLASTGITTGYADGGFHPTAPVSRQAMAAFLHRYDTAFGPSDPPVVVPPNPGDTKNCADFTTWADAQAWFDTYFPHYGDVAGLDGDGDGVACESLPGAP